MPANRVNRIWDNEGNPIGGKHYSVRFDIGKPGDNQIISVTLEEDDVVIRGVGPRPTLAIEPQASNAILVRFRDQ